jgi:hypothetical protein
LRVSKQSCEAHPLLSSRNPEKSPPLRWSGCPTTFRKEAAERGVEPDAPVIRTDKEGQEDNLCYEWESGDKLVTDDAFARADRVVTLDTHYPRSHPAPLETCGCVADVNPATKHVTVHMTSQAPHAHRTLFAMVTGLPEQNIRIISPDIGGGFGNKVPIYPGYVVATAASLVIGRPVKWIETRTDNLISTGFARDYLMHGEIAAKAKSTIALRPAIGRHTECCRSVDSDRRLDRPGSSVPMASGLRFQRFAGPGVDGATYFEEGL